MATVEIVVGAKPPDDAGWNPARIENPRMVDDVLVVDVRFDDEDPMEVFLGSSVCIEDIVGKSAFVRVWHHCTVERDETDGSSVLKLES